MFTIQPKPKDGLLTFEIIDKTTQSVTDFYNVEPFPNYEENENKGSLLLKGDRNELSKKLKELIGLNKSFIEIGSGTSQLSNYLAAGTNNNIVAFDPTEAALRLGYDFATKNNINNVTFVNADIFDDILQDEVFDWHVSDIRKWIKRNKLDKYIGQKFNGIPVTEPGMVAVAHIGGNTGMTNFIKSGGKIDNIVEDLLDIYGTLPVARDVQQSQRSVRKRLIKEIERRFNLQDNAEVHTLYKFDYRGRVYSIDPSGCLLYTYDAADE